MTDFGEDDQKQKSVIFPKNSLAKMTKKKKKNGKICHFHQKNTLSSPQKQLNWLHR